MVDQTNEIKTLTISTDKKGRPFVNINGKKLYAERSTDENGNSFWQINEPSLLNFLNDSFTSAENIDAQTRDIVVESFRKYERAKNFDKLVPVKDGYRADADLQKLQYNIVFKDGHRESIWVYKNQDIWRNNFWGDLTEYADFDARLEKFVEPDDPPAPEKPAKRTVKEQSPSEDKGSLEDTIKKLQDMEKPPKDVAEEYTIEVKTFDDGTTAVGVREGNSFLGNYIPLNEEDSNGRPYFQKSGELNTKYYLPDGIADTVVQAYQDATKTETPKAPEKPAKPVKPIAPEKPIKPRRRVKEVKGKVKKLVEAARDAAGEAQKQRLQGDLPVGYVVRSDAEQGVYVDLRFTKDGESIKTKFDNKDKNFYRFFDVAKPGEYWRVSKDDENFKYLVNRHNIAIRSQNKKKYTDKLEEWSLRKKVSGALLSAASAISGFVAQHNYTHPAKLYELLPNVFGLEDIVAQDNYGLSGLFAGLLVGAYATNEIIKSNINKPAKLTPAKCQYNIQYVGHTFKDGSLFAKIKYKNKKYSYLVSGGGEFRTIKGNLLPIKEVTDSQKQYLRDLYELSRKEAYS